LFGLGGGEEMRDGEKQTEEEDEMLYFSHPKSVLPVLGCCQVGWLRNWLPVERRVGCGT
jgi:hypothetical protein